MSADLLRLKVELLEARLALAEPLVQERQAEVEWVNRFDAKINMISPNVFHSSVCVICGDDTGEHNGAQIDRLFVAVPHDHRVSWRVRIEGTHATPRIACHPCTAKALRVLADEYDHSTVEAMEKAEQDCVSLLGTIGGGLPFFDEVPDDA